MSDAANAIAQIKDLPTFPGIVAQINEMIEDPNTSAEDIKNVISRDISLSASVLKLVNSSFYGFSRRITSITHALVILGFNAVRNLALSAYMMNVFKGNKDNFDVKGFWLHSIGAGVTLKCLGEKTGVSQPHELFIFGLMHDLGRIIMAQFFPKEFELVVKRVKEYDCLMKDAELAVFGYDHTDLGAALLDRWQLPVSMVNILKYHHRPGDMKNDENKTIQITYSLELADVVTRSLLIGNPGDELVPVVSDELFSQDQIDREALKQVMDQVTEEMKDARGFVEAVSQG